MTELTQHHVAELLCGHFSASVEVRPGRDRWSIVLPLVDDLNDRIEVDLWRHNNQWIVSDSGLVHREVALRTGVEDSEERVWEEVQVAANGFDLNWGGGQLWTGVDAEDQLGEVILRLAEAILMSIQTSGRFVSEVKVRFWEEVRLFFDDSRIPYERNKKVVGVSQVPHRIDFALQNGHLHLVQAIASEPSMRRSLNVFYDVLEAHPDIVPISFVDDAKSGYSNETFEQLSYKSDVYFWEDRARFTEYWRSRS